MIVRKGTDGRASSRLSSTPQQAIPVVWLLGWGFVEEYLRVFLKVVRQAMWVEGGLGVERAEGEGGIWVYGIWVYGICMVYGGWSSVHGRLNIVRRV
jgi:hypothetical protein